MKTIFRTLALSAAFLSMFTACQREELEQNQEPETPKTHTVTFVAGSPETKTTVDISDGKTAKFAWTDKDVSRFTVYENGVPANETVGVLGDDGKMTIMATFDWEAPESPSYQALYNTAVSSTQTANNLYDDTADVLVSAVLTDTDREAAGYLFSFKRESAIAKMTLKGLTDGVFVSSVTINSDKDIAGTYDLANGIFTSTSKTITIATLSEIKGGVATVWFASIPVEDATFTVTATTVDDEANVVATYTKTFTKTISLTRGDVKGFGVAMQEIVLSSSWEATDLSNINETMPVVITMAKGNTVYALSLTDTDGNALGANEAPKAITVSVIDGKLSNEPDSDILWNIANNGGNLTIYPNGITNKWLYAQDSANNGVRLGDSTAGGYVWFLDGDYLKTNSSETNTRYLGVYVPNTGNPDWRSYKLKSDGTIADNIKEQTLCFYTKYITKQIPAPKNLNVSESKVVTWDVVAGAASYTLTIGSKEYMCQTNTFDASDDALKIEDDYYTVSVVAIPSDTDKYDASTATTLTDAKFGTPTLATPSLEAGSVSEFSVNATWTVDSRAKNGYNCELYQGETKVGSQTVKTGSVTFDNLDDGVTYTLKVNAIAVDGTKAYAASDVALIELKTKETSKISDINSTGTYTVKKAVVLAVITDNNAIIGDETGMMNLYNSAGHGLKLGQTITVGGSVTKYSNCLQFSAPTISNIVDGSTPSYGEAGTMDEAYLTSYVSDTAAPKYVQFSGVQQTSNTAIKIGSKTITLSASQSSTKGKYVRGTGFLYGWNSSTISFYVVSIEEDKTVPQLSVTPTSKTWESDGVDAATFTVTTNTEGQKDWSVSPETLDWATIVVNKDAGTITITPKGENRTEAAYQTTLTVTHSADATLKQEISLTQERFIAVTGVSLDQTELSLAVGKTATLKATVNPSNATNQNVTWSSDKESVATVKNGVVTAVAEGTATITVTTEDGGHLASCTVNVATKQYTLTITKDSFNSTSYKANNKDKTTTAVAEDKSTIDVTWYSNQIMLQSEAMQWQKNNGYLYNKTDLGEIISVTVKSSEGKFTTYYGDAPNTTSTTKVGGGYFKVKVGSAIGKTSSVVIVFKK